MKLGAKIWNTSYNYRNKRDKSEKIREKNSQYHSNYRQDPEKADRSNEETVRQ